MRSIVALAAALFHGLLLPSGAQEPLPPSAPPLTNQSRTSEPSLEQILAQHGYTSITTKSHHHCLIVSGELNGKPLRFLIDTGAPLSVLDVGVANTAGVPIIPTGQTVEGINHPVPVVTGKVGRLSFDRAVIESRDLLVADLFQDAVGEKAYDAILGADLLREFAAVISYGDGRLFLKEALPPKTPRPHPAIPPSSAKDFLQPRGYHSIPLKPGESGSLVDGSIGASKITFLIDTGAFTSVLHLDLSKTADLHPGPFDQTIRGLGGNSPAAVTKVPSLTLASVFFAGGTMLSASLKKSGPSGDADLDHNVILGSDFLSESKAVISYPESLLFLLRTPPEPIPPAQGP